MSYKPLKTDGEYVVQYGGRTVGYLVTKKDGFELQPSVKGYNTVVDERLTELFDKTFPIKAALEGHLLKKLRQG